MRNGIRYRKPYFQFIRNSKDIPSFPIYYIKDKLKNQKKEFIHKPDIRLLLNSLLFNKKNIKVCSSILCYLFVTFDKNHHDIILIIDKYLGKHKISIPNSSEIPQIFNKVINTLLYQLKTKLSNISDDLYLQKQIEHSIQIILTDCIFKNIDISTCSLKERYPNILQLFHDVILPFVKKYDIPTKMLNVLHGTNENLENKLTSLLSNLQKYFKRMRDILYHNENLKKTIGYNLYIFLSKKSDKISHIPFFSNILSKHKNDIHKILTCISNNPHFTKRLIKKILGKISSILTQNKASINHNITSPTKHILRKCRSMVNNIFVFTKMGTSLYTVGKKVETKFPGISKTLFL
jgi:hypothetical protein